MDLELKDVPGQLVSVLRPISEKGGNIVSVVHHRDKKTPTGAIPVQITFEIEEKKVKEVLKELEAHGIRIVRAGEDRLRETTSVILVGHVVHTDIRDTIDAIDKTGFAEVIDLSLKMPGVEKPSAAFMTISATSEEGLRKALQILREISERKNLLLIEPVRWL
jgi:ACT domain-containing protein